MELTEEEQMQELLKHVNQMRGNQPQIEKEVFFQLLIPRKQSN